MTAYVETDDPEKMVNIFNKIIRRPRIDAMLVIRDETDLYTLPDDEAPYIKAIKCVYLYDKNYKTHLCEMTPSYYLIWLYTEVYFTEKGEELDEFEKNEYYEKYEHGGADEDKYFHCHDIDGMATKFKYKIGKTGVKYKDSTYDQQIEGLREHYCGNHHL